MRQVVLDTETTGLAVDQGHRVIEIGCVELVNRRPTGKDWWRYVNPGREIDAGAVQVHGITTAFLADKPRFDQLAQDLRDYLGDAELIIHNAPFDLGFLNHEFNRCGFDGRLEDRCRITDTVTMARKLNPGQKASLDALCKRYGIDNSRREKHGALLDASLLAEVYLAMTGGQSRLLLDSQHGSGTGGRQSRLLLKLRAEALGRQLPLIPADAEEWQAHQKRLQGLVKKAGKALWASDVPAAE